MSIHAMLAAAIKTPEIALDESESKMLAGAIANVARHYDLGVSEKAMDWGNLIIAATTIYGPRVMVIRNRRIAERAASRTSEPENENPGDTIDLGHVSAFMGQSGNA